jgi:hypothetical protein
MASQWNGTGTAWALYGMCELVFNVNLKGKFIRDARVLEVTSF